LLDLYERNPAVRIGGPTIHWLAEACHGAKRARENAAAIEIPVLLLQAGADRVVCSEAQKRFAATMAHGSTAGCTAYQLPGARHELLIEADRFRIPAVSKILDFFSEPSKKADQPEATKGEKNA
jgi:lysophospholipase